MYTFKLKEGITFHDGSLLTTEDVVATFERLLDPENVSVHSGVLTRLILGAAEFAAGEADEIAGITVYDE